jgi:UDP-N-acetylglucosamine--N-acetylmuramyl-(pentapeptide) pyrophosphoryl-undecaprenol N-acetylglucosamine transferase
MTSRAPGSQTELKNSAADGGVMILAGGTGGHVYPGLAVAHRLHEQHVHISWLGTRTGIEARAVPEARLGIHMEWINIRGVRGRGVRAWLMLPISLGWAMVQALRAMRRCRPQAVLSMGGFVAGPGGLVARMLRKPLLIHEQNAIPGLTNKWLALIASQVLSGFPGAFGTWTAARHVGNPVRAEIAAVAPPEQRFANRQGKLRLLVVGGSLGAQVFNEIVPQALRLMDQADRPDVRHQCGRKAPSETERAYGELLDAVELHAFIDDMAQAYAWADVVLCRAGAMTVAELAASGSASILVPYPHAVDDHQTANARYLSERDAGVLLPQVEFTAARLAELLRQFSESRGLLLTMARAARGCAVTDAAETVALMCREAMYA